MLHNDGAARDFNRNACRVLLPPILAPSPPFCMRQIAWDTGFLPELLTGRARRPIRPCVALFAPSEPQKQAPLSSSLGAPKVSG
jgi:hypothetical protein